MTQEEKELLLKDLCGRIPYHTKCYCEWSKDVPNGTSGCVQELSTFLIDELEMMGWGTEYDCQISSIKPYLRPMSSMTEEESKEYKACHCVIDEHTYFYPQMCTLANELNMFDWLNEHHFDYRGLIEKGLALEAPEEMYN